MYIHTLILSTSHILTSKTYHHKMRLREIVLVQNKSTSLQTTLLAEAYLAEG
jgi:hypothetical protein